MQNKLGDITPDCLTVIPILLKSNTKLSCANTVDNNS